MSAKTKRRFGSSELRQKASDLTEAQAVFNLRSKLAVAGIVAKFAEGYETWRRVLRCCAAIDCLFSLAIASKSFGDCCFPEFGADGTCELIEVRHPVLERTVSASGGSFIPNNIVLQSPVALITGLADLLCSKLFSTLFCRSKLWRKIHHFANGCGYVPLGAARMQGGGFVCSTTFD